MFNKLFEFSYSRTNKEAFGFYIAYLLMVILGAGVSSAIVALITASKDSFELGVRVGATFAIISCLSLSFLILKAKNLLGNFLYIILSLLSGLLAYLGGGLLGLIIPAFFSTRQPSK